MRYSHAVSSIAVNTLTCTCWTASPIGSWCYCCLPLVFASGAFPIHSLLAPFRKGTKIQIIIPIIHKMLWNSEIPFDHESWFRLQFMKIIMITPWYSNPKNHRNFRAIHMVETTERPDVWEQTENAPFTMVFLQLKNDWIAKPRLGLALAMSGNDRTNPNLVNDIFGNSCQTRWIPPRMQGSAKGWDQFY